MEEGAEDFEYVDRNYVNSIQNADGDVNNWVKFEEYFTNITGTKHKGGRELF